VISWLQSIAHKEGKSIENINYIFCSDDYLLNINNLYLDHDYYTDVISFPMSTDPIEGDVFISIDRIKENAENLKLPFLDELHRVMVHGLLHFLGYDDKTDEAQVKMTAMENLCLGMLE